ncbi:hypothetical protein V6N13_047748 [Hibiscus sabdariffa]|uniref:Uncharacterized protein n=1 Tax=Hibiscus sabdariffa TaxID=183260 RepID=A0ABR2F545_9ROSI
MLREEVKLHGRIRGKKQWSGMKEGERQKLGKFRNRRLMQKQMQLGGLMEKLMETIQSISGLPLILLSPSLNFNGV